MKIYITEDLIICFHQMWDTLPKMKFVQSTTMTMSLNFMSTPLPGSSSNDFEQSKITIFMKHPPDCQSSSAWLHRKTE